MLLRSDLEKSFYQGVAMRRIVIPALLLSLLVSVPARAQQAAPSPEALAAAKEMMTLVSGDVLQQTHTAIMNQALRPIENHPEITPEKMRELRAVMEKVTLRHLTTMLADAPAIYAKYLTVAEMREIIAFYRTPTGTKTLKVFPQVMPEVFALMQSRMPQMQRELAEAIGPILQKR
jgi:hypothetical protein